MEGALPTGTPLASLATDAVSDSAGDATRADAGDAARPDSGTRTGSDAVADGFSMVDPQVGSRERGGRKKSDEVNNSSKMDVREAFNNFEFVICVSRN